MSPHVMGEQAKYSNLLLAFVNFVLFVVQLLFLG